MQLKKGKASNVPRYRNANPHDNDPEVHTALIGTLLDWAESEGNSYIDIISMDGPLV